MENKSLGILKSMVVFFISLNFFSCSSSDPVCRVTSFSTENLFYDELKSATGYNPDFIRKIDLVYQNNKIIKVVGGLRYSDMRDQFYVVNDVEISVSQDGNSVVTTTPGIWSKEFVIANGQIVSKDVSLIRYFDYNHLLDYSPGLNTYEYHGNQITEMKNGVVKRIFYIENGNLVKVDWFFRNGLNEITSKYEYVFSGYDNNPNLLKGKFFIEGNFFKAFSNNNYKRYDLKRYTYVNGEYVDPEDVAWVEWGYLPESLFIEECQ